jgi:hypothetical protein
MSVLLEVYLVCEFHVGTALSDGVKIAGLGAGMTEAIIAVTPSETIKYAYADLNYVLLISFPAGPR